MTKRTITHEFVEFIPREMESGKLYISLPYGATSHLCLCGCGAEVVTPLSPVGWTLSYDGVAVSLTPSIGSWDLPCQSHYYIDKGAVIWARKMNAAEISAVKRRDRHDVERYYDLREEIVPHAPETPLLFSDTPTEAKKSLTLWDRIRHFLGG